MTMIYTRLYVTLSYLGIYGSTEHICKRGVNRAELTKKWV